MNSQFLLENHLGEAALQQQQQARQLISERWENLGFTKGLTGYMKDNMATLFENEAQMMLQESTDAQNSGSFETVVFPLVRRVFSRLLANDIVSVQAMNMPIGKLFFILPVTSERQWDALDIQAALAKLMSGDTIEGKHVGLMGYERHDRRTDEKVNRYYLPDEVVDDEPKVTEYFKKSLYDMFYNDGLFDQSKGKIHLKAGDLKEILGIAFDGSEISASGETRPLAFDGTVRSIKVKLGGFSPVNAGRLIGPDGNEMDTEAFLASLKIVTKKAIAEGTVASGETKTTSFKELEPVHFRVVTQQYGRGLVQYGDICNAQGEILLEIDLTKPTKEMGKTVDGYIGVAADSLEDDVNENFLAVWAQYDSLELETEIGEVSFKLTDVTVSVEERKLRATWSPELAQDVAAFHNIDAEAELTAILSEQIAAEIDREILRDLRKASPWTIKWDYNGWRRQAGFSTNYTQKDWNQTLMTKINQLSAQIHKATLRGGANFIVVSTEISAVLNDLEYFHVTDANAEAVQYSMGIEKVGSLQGRYEVFVDPYSPAQSLIMGHKGDSLLDTGYIYAPYVPMQLTPTIYNPFNFAPVKGIITRYAKKMVNNRYYASLVCNGLQTWDINELR
jgi:hypothetical protein